MMKKTLGMAAMTAFVLVLALSCDGEVTDKKHLDVKLHGIWESTDTSRYSGRLVFGSNTVSITGYAESQTPWNGSDIERPFRDFAKGAPLACYTEDGQLFIQTVGGTRSVPYAYSTSGLEKYLMFSFGDRQEALKRNRD